jgi:hypothetical protein
MGSHKTMTTRHLKAKAFETKNMNMKWTPEEMLLISGGPG